MLDELWFFFIEEELVAWVMTYKPYPSSFSILLTE